MVEFGLIKKDYHLFGSLIFLSYICIIIKFNNMDRLISLIIIGVGSFTCLHFLGVEVTVVALLALIYWAIPIQRY